MIVYAILPILHAGKVYRFMGTIHVLCPAFCVFRFRVWTTKGQKKLQEFLAEMGCVIFLLH